MVKTALVTGGTRGIGRAIVQRLLDEGYKLASVYAGNDQAAQTLKKINVSVYKWDIGDFASCQKGVEQVENDLGPVDILINNAGITRDGMFHKMTLQQWRDVLKTNLDSIFNMCSCVIEGMRERHYGRIINITSVNALKGQAGQTNYVASKAGMIGFSKALALETARKGITVNCVAPGYIETDMVAQIPHPVLESIIKTIPTGRLGKGEDVAHCVAFLASEHASFITGSVLSVNGGQYMA